MFWGTDHADRGALLLGLYVVYMGRCTSCDAARSLRFSGQGKALPVIKLDAVGGGLSAVLRVSMISAKAGSWRCRCSIGIAEPVLLRSGFDRTAGRFCVCVVRCVRSGSITRR